MHDIRCCMAHDGGALTTPCRTTDLRQPHDHLGPGGCRTAPAHPLSIPRQSRSLKAQRRDPLDAGGHGLVAGGVSSEGLEGDDHAHPLARRRPNRTQRVDNSW